MTEEVQTLLDTVVEPGLPRLGELLVAARERWNLTAADLARQLRLGLRQVQALEEDRFDALPGNTFVRGFIRNYARVVQTEPEAFLEAYERSRPNRKQPDIERSPAQSAFQRKTLPPWVWYVMAFIVVLLASPLLIYLALHDEEAASKALKQNAQHAPQVRAGAPTALPSPQAVVQNSTSDVASTMPATTSMQSDSPVAGSAPTQVASGEAYLQLHFNGDAWVEIRDKSGKIIFSQLNRSGQEQEVQGKPPFKLVVGNAGQVKIAYNGKPVDLLPHTQVNVARFKLE